LCNNRSNLEKGDVLFSGTGTIGEVAALEETPTNWNIKEGVYSIKPIPSILNYRFLMYLLQSSTIRQSYLKKAAGGTVKSVPMGEMRKLDIPVPPIEEQQNIVDILDRFDTLNNDLTAGLPAEIEKRRQQYEFYRDKLLTFKRKEA
jgi:type I restriction enzyme S subunit